MKYIFDGYKAHIYEVGIDVYEIQYSIGKNRVGNGEEKGNNEN